MKLMRLYSIGRIILNHELLYVMVGLRRFPLWEIEGMHLNTRITTMRFALVGSYEYLLKPKL